MSFFEGKLKAKDSSGLLQFFPLNQPSSQIHNPPNLKEGGHSGQVQSALQYSYLQKDSKENMPLSKSISAVSDKLKMTSFANKSPSHTAFEGTPYKKQKLEPYILIPAVSHSQLSRKAKSAAKTRILSTSQNNQSEQDVLVTALFHQFSHNGTATDGTRVVQDPHSFSESTRKRALSTHESSPDELLLLSEDETFSTNPVLPFTEHGSENIDDQGLLRLSEPPVKLRETGVEEDPETLIRSEYDAQPVPLSDEDEASESQSQSQGEDQWSGPPRHIIVQAPPVYRSAYYRRRKIAFLRNALVASEERERAGLGHYKPPSGWEATCRVPGRAPNETRSETPAQRYSAILENLYGEGDMRRGHGRKPVKVKAAPSDSMSASDQELEEESSEEESTAGGEVNMREDVRSESSTAPPVTPLDELLYAGGNATVNSPVIVVSENMSKEQDKLFAGDGTLSISGLEPEPASLPAPLDAVDARKLDASIYATKTQSISINADVSISTEPSPQSSGPAPTPKLQTAEKVVGVSDNSLPRPLPNATNHPVQNIRWFNPEEWRPAFRRLVSGKKKAGINDLMSINNTLNSLEGMIEALPGETLVQSLVHNVSDYLFLMKDLPPDYIAFGDQFDLRKRSLNVLQAVYGPKAPPPRTPI